MYFETRRRKKDYDRDRERDRDRDQEERSTRSPGKERPKSSQRLKTVSSREKDKERDTARQNSDSSLSSESQPYSPRKSSSSKRPQQERRTSSALLERTRSSQSYPTFSKAHSRESITKLDSGVRPVSVPYTPDPTDLNGERNGSPRASKRRTAPTRAPPSPPLTTVEPNVRRAGSGGSLRASKIRPPGESENARRSLDTLNPLGDGVRFSASRYSLREAEEGRSTSNLTPKSAKENGEATRPTGAASRTSRGSRSPYSGSPTRNMQSRSASGIGPEFATAGSNVDSDATPVPQDQTKSGVRPSFITRQERHASTGNTARPAKTNNPTPATNGQEPMIEVFASVGSESELAEPLDEFGPLSPEVNLQPPPPPPPAFEPVDIPRVDYLLQNGGLPNIVERSFSSAVQPILQQRYPQNNSTQPPPGPISAIQSVFAPYQAVLDDLDKVLSMSGSVAVATGYKSVARRLLERLEGVFARDISNEVCTCVMCEFDRQRFDSDPEYAGVNWGEILELVSGRKELPPWPPFTLPTNVTGLGISGLDQAMPMQKLDIDVPDEYREHYLRQSKKTKNAVQNWLASQPEDGPPGEVDDETLTFAMLTYLEPDQRRVFTALSRGLSSIPPSRAPTPAYAEPKSDLISRIGAALQRLYRLPRPPREPESCMYLLKNPSLHNTLATLAAISKHEWEILTSGRFDGFLWSGTEDFSQLPQSAAPDWSAATSRAPSRGPQPPASTPAPAASRTTTPFSPGGVPLPYGATPFRTAAPDTSARDGAPGPVQLDEETEIAKLADVERDIYLGMEALEDAFEQLHLKAEAVRKSLRARSAGLAAGARRRNGVGGGGEGVDGAGEELGARLGTPVLNGNGNGRASAPPVPLPSLGVPLTSTATTIPRPLPPHLQQHLPKHAFAPTPSPAPPTPTPDPDWTASGAFSFGFDDTASLAPDDSASNVGWRERERRHRERDRSGGGGSGAGLASGARGLGKKLTRRLRTEVVREEG